MNEFEINIDHKNPEIPSWVFDGLLSIAAGRIYSKCGSLPNEAYNKLVKDAAKGGKAKKYIDEYFGTLQKAARRMTKKQLNNWYTVLSNAFCMYENNADDFINYYNQRKPKTDCSMHDFENYSNPYYRDNYSNLYYRDR